MVTSSIFCMTSAYSLATFPPDTARTLVHRSLTDVTEGSISSDCTKRLAGGTSPCKTPMPDTTVGSVLSRRA